MKSILEKFKYWDNLILTEEEKLTYILTKIFNSMTQSLVLLTAEDTTVKDETTIKKLVNSFEVSKPFQNNIKIFFELYSLLIKNGFFEIVVKNIDTQERMRKNSYHIWNLFKHAHKYNELVRNYNDRIYMPERFLTAKLHGYKTRLFIYDNRWYKNSSSVNLIGIAGPSCSGKSTVSDLIKNQHEVSYINVDNFFKKSTDEVYEGYPNWEHKNSIMFDRLYDCLKQLKNGEPTLIPSKGWTEQFDYLIYPNEVVIIDGFILFVDSKVSKLLDTKIFLDLDENNQYLRRIKREGHQSSDYIRKVVIPHYHQYKPQIVSVSDYVIDGNKSKTEVKKEIQKVIGKIEK